MPNHFNLIDGLQTYVSQMTPAELMHFRRELAHNLPGFLERTAEAARQAAGSSKQLKGARTGARMAGTRETG